MSDFEGDIVLGELIAPIVRRWRTVALVVAVAVCMAIVHLLISTPQYEARARLIVLAPNEAVTDLQTLQFYRNLVPTYKEILSSRRVMEAVRREVQLAWSADEYRRRVRIEANEEAQTLEVIVRADSPFEASRIATGAAKVMTRVAAEVMRDERLVLLDPAVPPDSPVSPRATLEIPVAAFLGLLVGVGLAFALEMFDRRIRDEASVERRLGLPVLGVIPHIDL